MIALDFQHFLSLEHRHPRMLLQDIREHTFMVGIEMLNKDEGHPGGWREFETSFYLLRRPVSQLQDVERLLPSTNISIFPNPASNTSTVTFTIDEPLQVKLSLVDALGRTIETLPAETLPPGRYERQVQVQTLPNGPYFIRLQRGAMTKLTPFIVRK